MKKSIYFITPTLVSYIDLISMGGSDKVGDSTKVGMYNSGLKFAMALALQNNIDLSVKVYDTTFSENFDRERETLYTIGTFNKECEQTGKEKEVLVVNKNVSLQSFFSIHCEDLGGGDLEQEEIITGFSTKLGVDWKLYMLLREIYSNTIDEEGGYSEELPQNIKYGTVVTLSFEEDSEFAEIWENRHLYINEKEPLFRVSDSVEVLENVEGYIRIYKQNILVYENPKRKSKFAYNVKFGSIDERRILSNVYDVERDIAHAILRTDNEEFLREVITADFEVDNNDFLGNVSVWNSVSDLANRVATEIYNEHGSVSSYEWLMNSIKSRPDCEIGGKRIRNIQDSLYNYSSTVTVESQPIPFAKPAIEVENEVLIHPFAAEIKKYYNFDLDVCVQKAQLSGSKAIADKFNKCIIIDENFDIKEDFPEFIIQYLDLTMQGNVVKNAGKYICKLLEI